MSRWKDGNRWLEERPLLIRAAEVALPVFLWALALVTERVASYVVAIAWTVIVLVVQPLKRRSSS